VCFARASSAATVATVLRLLAVMIFILQVLKGTANDWKHSVSAADFAAA